MRFFKRARRRVSGPPSDEEIAAQMRSIAQVFVDGVAAQGQVYDYIMTGKTAPDTPRESSPLD